MLQTKRGTNMKKMFVAIIAFLIILCAGFFVPNYEDCIFAYEEDTLGISSKSAILIDAQSGKVIYSKNADEKLPIASMTKTMTLLLCFEAQKEGRVNMNDSVCVSEYAASMEGSECFLDPNKHYALSELIKAVVVSSANDACVAIAEHTYGSEELFVRKMNERAKMLNMTNTEYKNVTGLDASGHVSSASDTVKVMTELVKYDEYKRLSGIWMDEIKHEKGRRTELVNTNRLVKTFQGLEAGKTGYTEQAKYCIVASANKNNMRLIGCLIGAEDSKTRFADMTKMLNYGFSNFECEKIVSADTSLGEIAVKRGNPDSQNVYSQKDVFILKNKGEKADVSVKTILDENLIAPAYEGQKAGKYEVYVNGVMVEEGDLVIKNSSTKIRLKDKFKLISKNYAMMSR